MKKEYKKWIYVGIVGVGLIVFFAVPLVKNGGVSITLYQWLKELIAGTYSD